MLKRLIMAILYIPFFIIAAIFLFVGVFIDNILSMLTDNRLSPTRRVGWYMFHIAPDTCPDCGDSLKRSGYNARYTCLRCDKVWASEGSF